MFCLLIETPCLQLRRSREDELPALAYRKPGSWYLALAVFLAGEPIGLQDLWAEDFAVRKSIASGSSITRARQGPRIRYRGPRLPN